MDPYQQQYYPQQGYAQQQQPPQMGGYGQQQQQAYGAPQQQAYGAQAAYGQQQAYGQYQQQAPAQQQAYGGQQQAYAAQQAAYGQYQQQAQPQVQQQAAAPAQQIQQQPAVAVPATPATTAAAPTGPGESAVDTGHEDMVHDVQFDYYGKRLATCSSDRTIRIFETQAGATAGGNTTGAGGATPIATITGHQGPVWQVAWAHPRWGSLLASASYDGSVMIHRENRGTGQWDSATVHQGADSQSCNSIAWGPAEDGLYLACASSDGFVYIYEHRDDNSWEEVVRLRTSTLGTNAVSWAPVSQDAPTGEKVWRLVTGSCDNEVRVWTGGPAKRTEAEWTSELMEDGHKDWVRDVAWAPATGAAAAIIASAGEDGKVFIWTQEPGASAWKKTALPLEATTPATPVWRVSWSITGNVLAVSSGDQKVSLWKQRLNGDWAPWQEANGGEWKKVDAAAQS